VIPCDYEVLDASFGEWSIVNSDVAPSIKDYTLNRKQVEPLALVDAGEDDWSAEDEASDDDDNDDDDVQCKPCLDSETGSSSDESERDSLFDFVRKAETSQRDAASEDTANAEGAVGDDDDVDAFEDADSCGEGDQDEAEQHLEEPLRYAAKNLRPSSRATTVDALGDEGPDAHFGEAGATDDESDATPAATPLALRDWAFPALPDGESRIDDGW